MKITHRTPLKSISGEGEDNFILANSEGYISLSEHNISKYQGVNFGRGTDSYKTIHNLHPKGKILEIVNNFHSIERIREGNVETFFMPLERDAFVYSLENEDVVEIVLDCRKQYDFDDSGRVYDIFEEDGKTIVKYTKEGAYELFLAFDEIGFEKIDKWDKHSFSYDKKRSSSGFEYFVYHAFKIKTKQLIMGFGMTKEDAIKEMDYVVKNLEDLKEECFIRTESALVPRAILKKNIEIAALCARNALDGLVAPEGVMAGYYWFHQYWGRDELISLKALIKKGDFSLAKQVIFKWIGMMQKDGRIPNRVPASSIGSADAIGWLWKRVDDLILELLKKKRFEEFLSKDDLRIIKHHLEKSAYAIKKHHEVDGLITNGAQETWMDSDAKRDPRDGARIEINAMQMNMYSVIMRMAELVEDDAAYTLASNYRNELKKKVYDAFWNGHYLKDGSEDATIRPNLFIAYYMAPDILSKKEWKACFENVLPRLWTGFGLSSIDIHSPLYQPKHTGEADTSYHRGDVWYWINNLAAICLHKVATFKFGSYLHAILESSTNDLLWQGIPGAASEISSAEVQEAFGCFDQAWSAAMFIEMLEEVL